MDPDGAQRASRRNGLRRLATLLLVAMALAGAGFAPSAANASTAPLKVVIVVGPVGSMTSTYIADARALAKQARFYGAAVTEIYSPTAVWSRVKTAVQGANLLIYLGHGNGTPSPYPYSPLSKNGLGLNAAANHGNSNVKYYGEYYVKTYLRLAPNAVVILNHLCYSAGNSEPGAALPTKSVARQRIDNYGAPFLKIGAKAVFAEARNEAGYILASLFTTSRTMSQIFWSSPRATRTYRWSFTSSKTAGATGISDPYSPSHYYRSVVGMLGTTATAFR